ncbi:UDP-N-acetylmuramate--L-alanine ligase [Deinococcus maricopensis]|uniref:UDP-N-acetylmuramate--L-alanine ligase n=1 Tax=Deinococcus maricopensis (strain DSM 21211 / LMG 22137 / NRRL B-23946 / LB-34) TaxID=709986 RepID=E8U8A8_DEIML|nr:UDP-N-acetylmuramate--L-alanine ligase [Deinococcus maricopensis]ADV67297.1 UDP-N-acetylmuramate--L-alanine ligase [Deinococcus maricopensis DSM 21211]
MTKPHYHFMGVGGIGVSALARLLAARGYQVTGCDEHPSELTEQLRAEGIPVHAGHDAAHVRGVDVLVASEAVPKDHPELTAAHAQGVEVQPRMRLLGELLAGGPSVGVIGTHGKTTTTSMIAVTLAGAGLDPAAFVGGIVPEFGSNARVGAGPFVAEVDESDPKFQELACGTAVFTNAEDDHIGGAGTAQATYWESVEAQHAAFARFVRQAERVLACADWVDAEGRSLDALLVGAREVLTYGTGADCTYRAVDVRPDANGTSFTVERRGEVLGSARVRLPGTHNVLNGLAALAVADLHGADFPAAAAALAAFTGPGRRWQHIGELNGALVIDDYAHNATKVAAAIEAAHQTGRRVRVVFQPHRYLRTQQSWPRLAQSLMGADEVLLLDIAAASEPPIEGIHATLISDRMREEGHAGVRYSPDRAQVVQYLRETAAPGDVIVTMGAGDVWRLSRELAGVAVGA